MTLEIKTSNVEPIRQNYAYIERRFGSKPATRYQEVSFDVQAEANFHYRPLWKPEKTLNDKTHTVLQMQDWYAFKDPRQFYYGTYVQHRARLQDTAESNFAFLKNVSLQNICLMKSKLRSLSTYCHFATLNKLQTYT